MRMTKLSTSSLSMPNTRVRSAIVASAVAAVIGLAAPSTSFANKGEDRSKSTCYVVAPSYEEATRNSYSPPAAIRYLTESLGSINSDSEVRYFNHLKQYAYDVTGKATLLLKHDVVDDALANNTDGGDLRIMSTTSGAAIVGKKVWGTYPKDKEGAHLGLTINFGRSDAYNNIFLGPLFLECTSPYTSQTPDKWHCSIKLDGDLNVARDSGVILGQAFGLATEVDLYKVNPAYVQACSVFQDGEYFPKLPINLGKI